MKAINENDVLLTTEKTAELTGIQKRTLEYHRYMGRGLPYCKIGKAVRYRLGDVRAYIEANMHNTSDAA